MSLSIYDFSSFSIAIAALIAMIRFRGIYPGFRPFLFVCWASLVTEIVCYILVNRGNYTFIPFGIYSLVESLLLTWFFCRMGIFGRLPRLFIIMLAIYLVGWISEVAFFRGLSHNMNWFRLIHSFIVVLFTVVLLSKEVAVQRRSLLRSPVFLVCTGFLLYYSCAVIAGVFELQGENKIMRGMLQMIMIYVNLIVNLIYALAVLWMPRYLRYSLPY